MRSFWFGGSSSASSSSQMRRHRSRAMEESGTTQSPASIGSSNSMPAKDPIIGPSISKDSSVSMKSELDSPKQQMEPLLMEGGGKVAGDHSHREDDDPDKSPLLENNNNKNGPSSSGSGGGSGGGGGSATSAVLLDSFFAHYFQSNPEFFKQAFKFFFCFCGLQASYLTWGYMQELIMTTEFKPTRRVPTGKFPSAAFCVFSNRFLAVLVALVAVRIKHGAFFANNKAPLWAFTPCALSNTMSSWSQYASLKYVSFPVQTVFKSSKIIPVMIMGKVLKGTEYPATQYLEAFLITVGVAIFSVLSKTSDRDTSTEVLGLVFLLMYICFDSFTSQWQDKIYGQYGRDHVDQYQMMLGVNTSAICITTAGLILTGDFPIVWEFLMENPVALRYNIITAITSASGQLCIFYTIKEFGPIAFTIIMTTRQMFSICISAVVFGHLISAKAACGALLVFGVLFYQIRRKYNARREKKRSSEQHPATVPGKQ